MTRVCCLHFGQSIQPQLALADSQLSFSSDVACFKTYPPMQEFVDPTHLYQQSSDLQQSTLCYIAHQFFQKKHLQCFVLLVLEVEISRVHTLLNTRLICSDQMLSISHPSPDLSPMLLNHSIDFLF